MNGLLIGFVVFLIIVAVVMVVTLLIIQLRAREEDDDSSVVWNFASNRCNKKSAGPLKSKVVGRGGRELITYSVNGKPVPERVITDKAITVAKGTLDEEKERIIILPRNTEDLEGDLKNSELGKLFGKYIEEKNNENNVIAALREKKDRQEAIRLLHGGGELSKEEIQRRNELIEELSAIIIKSAEKKSSE
jgi:hypothetical protein